MSDEKTKKRIPVKRWIALALIGLGIFFGFLGPAVMRPIRPVVLMAAEELGAIGGFPITNTMVATLVADLALLVVAFITWRLIRGGGGWAPAGFYGVVEWIIEFLWNMSEGTAGKWARRIFPWMATIFLLVFAANLTKLIPGYESIGFIKEAHVEAQGIAVRLFGEVYGLRPLTAQEAANAKEAPAAQGETAGEESAGAGEKSLEGLPAEVVPALRGAATDLNFTLALALVAMFMVQVFGVWSLGLKYFEKFFYFRGLVAGDIFRAIDFGVGLLELISEFGKVLSFTFRLFGNIFAGALLLSIIGTLTVAVVPAGIYLFEVFVAVIQAYVFSLLALVFMTQATVGHHGEEHA